MKKTFYLIFPLLLIVTGCSIGENLNSNQNTNQNVNAAQKQAQQNENNNQNQGQEANSSTGPESSMQEYKNNKYGFSIEYPNTWEIASEYEQQGQYFWFLSPKYFDNYDLFLTIYYDDTLDMSIKEYVESEFEYQNRKNEERNRPLIKKGDSFETTVNGKPAYKIKEIWGADGLYDNIYLIEGSKVFEFEYLSSHFFEESNINNSFSEDVEKIISTFTIY
ncbi:hypothetical protein KKC88_00310 [Patescibacteria group bacterium]|nr:hypothetical protein [Patescibacteria group bacterium]MBU1673097.1 hypothetical protein [Patescibacteria group bacterium]MBU1963378.1 hypothetical protein [Patescibacteria group bacterium]